MEVTSPVKTPGKGRRSIQSLDRAFRLLRELGQHRDGLRLKAAAERAGLAVQTAQSLLRTLEDWEMVVQPERGGAYVLGPGALALAAQWLALDGHAALARPCVEALSGRLGEYILLAELRGTHLYRLIEVHSPQALMVQPSLTEPARLHTMATGKILLAFLPETERERRVAGLDLVLVGRRSLTDRRAFLAHLAQVRRQGYAESVRETAGEIAALAVPVRDAEGRVHAALGTAVPTPRYGAARRRELLAALRASAAEIEAAWHANRD